MQLTTATRTAHKHDCRMAFGRKDPSCPRCQELLAGAPPVRWAWADRAKADAKLQAMTPRQPHRCVPGRCSPVCCTHGDY